MRRTTPIRGVAAIILMAMVSGSALAQETEIVFPITINAVSIGETTVMVSGSDVYVPVSALARSRATGVSWERVLIAAKLRRAEKLVAGEPAVSLESLQPWTTFELDEANLTLAITVDPSLISASALALDSPRPRDIRYSEDASTFFNYAVSTASFSDVSAIGEIGSSIGGNLLYSSFSSAPGIGFTRGLSNYTINQRDRLRQIVFGDANIFGDELGGTGIVAGATVGRSFDLDPYFIRFPSLNLRGVAVTPSEVEIYVNGVLVERRPVPPGPFEITNLTAASGTSAATVVIRDAFGREQTSSSSFYYSTEVLGEGLSEYTYSAGVVRELFGSFDYDEPLVFAAHRYGVTNQLTIGGRIEATDSIVSGGPNVAFASRFGEFDLKFAASSENGETGTAGQFGFRRLSRRASIAGTLRVRSREYANFSTPIARDRALREATVFASYLPSWGNIGLQWTMSEMRDTGQRKRLAALTNISVADRASILVSAAAVEENNDRFGEYFVGLSFRPFHETTLNVAAHSRDGVSSVMTELQRPLPVGTGWGYRLQANSLEDGATASNASVQYQNEYGRYEVGMDPEHPDAATVSAAGGLVYQAGKIVPTRPVAQSFALVRVPGVEGVRIYLSNQLVGRTDARGDLLVPNLLPHYGNRIRIEDRDVPMTHDIQIIEQTIAPPSRGGALVVFPAREIRAAAGSVLVRTSDGEVVPKYGEIRIRRGDEADVSPIGGSGDFYFENLSPGSYQATVQYEGGRCSFVLQIPDAAVDIIDLGNVVCAGVTP